MDTTVIAFIGLWFTITNAKTIRTDMKAIRYKQIRESNTTADLPARSLLICAALCSMEERDCCALSYSNQICRLDFSCQYTIEDNANSNILYVQRNTGSSMTIINYPNEVTTIGSHKEFTQSTANPCIGCIQFGSSFYLLIKTPVTWVEAKDDCESRSGKLLEIETTEENEFVKGEFSAVFKSNSWIAAFKQRGSGLIASEFSWISTPDQQMGFTDWRSNEPDGADCVIMGVAGGYHWASNDCFSVFYYTCEFEN